MNAVFFESESFIDYESGMCIINASRSEYSDHLEFSRKCLEYLDHGHWLWDNDTDRALKPANGEDVDFMKSVIATNLKDSVKLDFEEALETYTFEHEEDLEHMLILCSEYSFTMLFWHTSA